MALISCSECGKQISSLAKCCPNCGCPVVSDVGMVSIKLPKYENSMFISTKISIFDDTGKSVWEGRQGQVAQFYVKKPTKIEIKMSMANPIVGTVRANKKYACIQDNGIHWYAKYYLTEVDIIDVDYFFKNT